MTVILGPVACHDCGRPVVVDRVGNQVQVRASRLRRHVCGQGRAHKPRCSSIMTNAWGNGEACARTFGHRGNHSTRYALDNAARARRGGYPA